MRPGAERKQIGETYRLHCSIWLNECIVCHTLCVRLTGTEYGLHGISIDLLKLPTELGIGCRKILLIRRGYRRPRSILGGTPSNVI